ncbi:hypothetical protein [Pseudoneobacillus rhizosphaerae]|uniref:Uncharacterized protein n=1 Tax=Pseudoneobacillus rhizosphaerae TaxID=2880968 RepID=A0A9C7GAZ7_9BACI|nr:hypothetical protein [Pseudoneobacillus rhizosphaerae]CAG9609149.1 hypothetical protein NEOCIP111885_02890 [Pseudoneobacillus rhizosphaerae]
MSIFNRLSSIELSEQISFATQKVIYAAPGIHKEVTDSMINCIELLGKENIVTIIDKDPEICRLGYGEIEAIERLLQIGTIVRKAYGLRIGVLIVDNNAWIFSPTPLLIENQFNRAIINAINVNLEQGLELIRSISPDLFNKDDNAILKESYKNSINNNKSTPEIGKEKFNKGDLDIAKKDLNERPPKKFDFERRVRTYSSHIQFVELSLPGLQLNRRTLKIPSKLLNVSNNKEAQERLKATYSLINENSKISSKDIEQQLLKIRRTYLKSLGKRVGNIILRQKKEEFLSELEKIKVSIDKFSANIRKNLEKELEKSKKELCKILLPGVMQNPPDDLKGGILTKKPDKNTATAYLNFELDKVIPQVDELVNDIKLYCDFKDVTYEMLTDNEFQKNLRIHFPHVPWPKPFDEHYVIPEKDPEQMKLTF